MKFKTKIWLRRTGWSFLGMAAFGVLVWSVLNIVTGIQLRKEVALYQEQGLPLSVSELSPLSRPAADENAAQIYEKAFGLMEAKIVTGKLDAIVSEMVLSKQDYSDSLLARLEDDDLQILLGFVLEA